MVMPNKLRIGVIGVGFGAQVHIPAFQSEGLDVVAVAARRKERAEETAEKFNINHVFSDYNDMLLLKDIDAISIATPAHLHLPIVLAALAANKHILCEKPFSTDQIKAKQMLDASKKSTKTTMIAHEFRFSSGRSRVKELIDEGYIGNLHMVLLSLVNGPRTASTPRTLTDRDVAEFGGGFLNALGSHYIDALRQWFGEITTVSGKIKSYYPERLDPNTNKLVNSDTDDTFQFTLQFAKGGWATMIGTSAAPYGPGGRIEIYGSNGTLITPHTGIGMNPPSHGTIMGANIGDKELTQQIIPQRLEPFTDDRDDRMMPFRLLTREFIRGINEEISPSPNFYDGYRCQQVLDAVKMSAQVGGEIKIIG